MSNKSNIRLTSIRTGNGDLGDTKLGGKSYRKSSLLVQYSSALDLANSCSTALDEKWGDFIVRDTLQELLFRLGATIGGRAPKGQELAVQEIAALMETQLQYITGGLKPLDSFLRATPKNSGLHFLRAVIRQAETLCVAAHDQIELESRDTSEQLLYGLLFSARALNIASDWVFGFVWLHSTDELGAVTSEDKWVPWSDDKIRGLN
jgi:cob(I)alamin adenosyltransferase